MIQSKGYAAHQADESLVPFSFERRDIGLCDVLIQILYCGICHADIHQSRNEHGRTIYPLVPGHEIVGRVKSTGNKVSKFSVGDLVGVGYFIDSCKHCSSCAEGEEQYCENGFTPTQNGRLPDGRVTKGGYSDNIIVNEEFVLEVPETLYTAGVAPLLCAGITAYSPFKHWNIGKGHQVAVLGLGGLGHMAVKFAVSFGAQVTVLSRSASKEKSAFALGAHHFVPTTNEKERKRLTSSFDFIIDTVSGKHDYNMYLSLLKKEGIMIILGVPPEMPQLAPFQLISKRRRLAGSFVGGIKETQEMLDYCAEKNITAEVEVIAPDYINKAFERMLAGDVQYRFVIDLSGL